MEILIFLILQIFMLQNPPNAYGDHSSSILGDPGMRSDGLRVAFEGWNFCNEVGSETRGMGSPRLADCFDFSEEKSLDHKVKERENKLGVGKPFPGLNPRTLNNPDLYAAEKELYLGSLCEVEEKQNPWQFWMVMLKNGNFDTKSGLCPENGKRVGPFPQTGRFPCFRNGCMNQPMVHHQHTYLDSESGEMEGGFNGTYDLDGDSGGGIGDFSYFEVVWRKKAGTESWVFSHKVKTTKKYPWVMFYHRRNYWIRIGHHVSSSGDNWSATRGIDGLTDLCR